MDGIGYEGQASEPERLRALMPILDEYDRDNWEAFVETRSYRSTRLHDWEEERDQLIADSAVSLAVRKMAILDVFYSRANLVGSSPGYINAIGFMAPTDMQQAADDERDQIYAQLAAEPSAGLFTWDEQFTRFLDNRDELTTALYRASNSEPEIASYILDIAEAKYRVGFAEGNSHRQGDVLAKVMACIEAVAPSLSHTDPQRLLDFVTRLDPQWVTVASREVKLAGDHVFVRELPFARHFANVLIDDAVTVGFKDSLLSEYEGFIDTSSQQHLREEAISGYYRIMMNLLVTARSPQQKAVGRRTFDYLEGIDQLKIAELSKMTSRFVEPHYETELLRFARSVGLEIPVMEPVMRALLGGKLRDETNQEMIELLPPDKRRATRKTVKSVLKQNAREASQRAQDRQDSDQGQRELAGSHLKSVLQRFR